MHVVATTDTTDLEKLMCSLETSFADKHKMTPRVMVFGTPLSAQNLSRVNGLNLFLLGLIPIWHSKTSKSGLAEEAEDALSERVSE